MTEELWDVEYMAKRYHSKEGTIRAWVRLGHIPFVRIGKRMVRFDPEVIRQWERTRANIAPAAKARGEVRQ